MTRRSPSAGASKAGGDYHRYVLRDGRLVGQFERMYREATEVPWHQDKAVETWWSDIAVRVLRIQAPYPSAIEIGCGLGYFTNRIAPLCGDIVGTDVSRTAIARARARFPHLTFSVLDIRRPRIPSRRYSLVVVKDIFWYVFPRLPAVIRNIDALTAADGRLFVFQSFPPPDRPFVGRDVIPTAGRLVELLEPRFILEYSCRCEEHERTDGSMFVGLFRKRRPPARRRGR